METALSLAATGDRAPTAVGHAAAGKSIEAMIMAIRSQLDEVGTELAKHIETHHADLAMRLSSVRAIGPSTVATWLAEVPELGAVVPPGN